ncbi:NAD(P)-dependent oxidoreductase [Asinibacterium sp. OR53]|uniref:NAD-dependent epimerase/dehydratase family protein n=1 Tax=Asinibacterium sp. OR53 TaxID=925409 RepID=UPI000478C5E6|nr:NAD(P)-dependent oxidoreductase [Asinibacterium sp. OR53]
MRNILITGASGFIGSALVDEALQRGFNTFAGIRNSSRRKYLAHPGIRFLELDLSDDEALDLALRGFRDRYDKLDVVIHAAGVTKAVRPADYRVVNCGHTRRLVHALMRNGLIPRKFVYLSSLASFGPGVKRTPISLAQERNPVSKYGQSKLEAEQFLFALRDFPFVIINPTAVYGPRDTGFLPVLKCLQQRLDIGLRDEGRLLSFLHVNDLCQAVFLCVESPVLHKQFLISDLRVYTQKSFAHIAGSVLNKSAIPVALPAWMVSGVASIAEAMGYITGRATFLNRDRLRDFKALNWSVCCPEMTELGFKPCFGLEEGLRQAIGWYREAGWLKQ